MTMRKRCDDGKHWFEPPRVKADTVAGHTALVRTCWLCRWQEVALAVGNKWRLAEELNRFEPNPLVTEVFGHMEPR